MRAMMTRPPSPAPRPSFAARVLCWLKRAWRDRLPIAGWLAAWREQRRQRRTAARRPQVAQLRPECHAFEDRSAAGLDVSAAVRIGLVAGVGYALVGEFCTRLFAHADTLPADVPPGTPSQIAEASPRDVPPTPALALGGGGGQGGEAGWGSRAVVPADVPEDSVTHLTSADLTGVPGGLDLDPGLGDATTDSGAAKGGSGAGSPANAPTSSAGGSRSGMAPGDPPPGGSSTPAPSSGGAGGNSGSGALAPSARAGGAKTGGGATLAGATATGSNKTTTAAQIAGTGTGGGTSQADATNVSRTFGTLPLPIEVNVGQAPAAVQYLSHGPGFGFYLTADGAATLDLTRPGQDATPGATVTRDALRLSFAGASASPRLLPQAQQAGRSNYLSGTDPTRWLTNVPQFSQVLAQGLYSGIDVAWHSTPDRELEYDFVVAPGADPSAIRLHIDGATSLSLDNQGNLLIGTGGGTLVQSAPVLSQAGSGGARQAVTGSTVILDGSDVGFQVGAYDTTRALTIDPVLIYSTYLGGSGDDKAYAIAADGSGDVYVTGATTSTNFPISTGSYQATSPGQAGFVTKLNAAGNGYVYSTYISGSHGSDVTTPLSIAVDAAGESYIAGNTTATDFPVTSGVLQGTAGAGGASFVSKFSDTGDLLYSTYLGNSSTAAKAIAVDSAESAYVTGATGSGFPATSGALQATFGGGAGTDAFVAKLNSAATTLTYSTY
jgi:hypothetical protein